jgi:hypothetical protein
MVQELKDGKNISGKADNLKVKFTCQCCQKKKPIEDMKRIKRFNPVLIVCRDCEKIMR